MRKLLTSAAEPVALIALALTIVWLAHAVLAPVRVAGWSMNPTLVPGDLVFVRLGARPIAGDVVLVHAAGHAPLPAGPPNIRPSRAEASAANSR